MRCNDYSHATKGRRFHYRWYMAERICYPGVTPRSFYIHIGACMENEF